MRNASMNTPVSWQIVDVIVNTSATNGFATPGSWGFRWPDPRRHSGAGGNDAV